MAHLQPSIDKVLGNQGIEHLVVIVTPAMFTIFASMKWHLVGPESLTLGFFRNPFLWGACDEEDTNALNLWAQFILGRETEVSGADAQSLLKVVVHPRLEEESINNLKRMMIVTSVLLTEGHKFLSHIRDHIAFFDNYKQNCRHLAMTNASRQGTKVTYHPHFLALRLSNYWRA